MKEYSGKLTAEGATFALIVSRFNGSITERLLAGALDFLRRSGAHQDRISVIRVPGSFEIPQTAARVAGSGRYQAVICLGCLIRGETGHYDYIAQAVTEGISQVGIQFGIPVTFGVITADTPEQALNRSGLKYGNKGIEAAQAAVELANLFAELEANQDGEQV